VSVAVTDDTITKIGNHPGRSGNRTLWITLVVMIGLLAAAGVVGAFVGPGRNPAPVGGPTGGAAKASSLGTDVPAAPRPTLVVPSGPARPADALGPWAGRIGSAIDVPAVAVAAYAYAQLLVQQTTPQCHLGWTTLAGLGQVDSQHGQAGGAVLDKTGRSSPPVLGPPLDGQEGRPLVPDTDAGAYDADDTYDRGMGPLLLVPTVWRENASDGDDDDILDPYDIDDASLAMAKLLCAGGDDLAQISGWTAAMTRLGAGEAFTAAVYQAADSYGQRTRNVQ
jgi:membrane-bound lytic murein transglycosylase B